MENTCKGVHCKCLYGKAGGCPNWHNGDHTCGYVKISEPEVSVTIGGVKYVPEDLNQYAKGYKQGQIDMREIMLDEINTILRNDKSPEKTH